LNDDSKLSLHIPLSQGRKHAKKRLRINAVKQDLEMRRSTHSMDLRRNTVKRFWQFEKEDLDWWEQTLLTTLKLPVYENF
jgi:hypothetical protein